MYPSNYGSPRIDTHTVVFKLIAINIVFFLATLGLPYILHGFDPYRVFGLHYPASTYFKPFQLLTHMFMHGDIWHIFFNMFNLYMFGTALERVWGAQRFMVFYLITGFGAVLLHTGVQAWEVYQLAGTVMPSQALTMTSEALYGIINAPTVGASGAVFGLLTAFGVLFSNTELYIYGAIPVKAKYLVGGLIVYELYRGVTNSQYDHVAHFAHLGGALIGFVIVRMWSSHRDSLY
jgi:membrane associated rhomboid family serine protease